MQATEYLSRLNEATARTAAASVTARMLANQTQAERLDSIDPMNPAASDLSALVGYDTGIDDLVMALEPTGAGHWWTRAAFHDISTAAVQTLARTVAPPVHRSFLTIINAPDFRPFTAKFGFYGAALQEVTEAEDYPVYHPDRGESDSATCKLTNYGNCVAITRKALINDRRLGFLGRMVEALTGSAYRKEASLVYAALEINPNLRDGSPWFGAGNSVSSASLTQAMIDGFKKFHEQTLPNGELLNAQPAVLVIPPDWSVRASDLISDILLQIGRLTIINSGAVTSGYLFASPSECPALGLLALQANAVPEVRVQRRPKSGFLTDTDALFRVTHPMAVMPLSRLGVVKIEVAP